MLGEGECVCVCVCGCGVYDAGNCSDSGLSWPDVDLDIQDRADKEL